MYSDWTATFNHVKSSIRFHKPIYSAAPYLHSDLISGVGKCVLSVASAEPVEVVSGFTLSSYFTSYSWGDGTGEI